MWSELLITLGKIVVVFGAVLGAMAYLTYFERKVLARMQARIGPNRTGPVGVLQPMADGLKLLTKEAPIPERADRWVYLLAPVMVFVPALLTWAVVPFGPTFRVFGRNISMFIANINVGLIYMLAMSSVGVYGIVMAGWASNNKYAMIGGLRSTAQVISYEATLGLSLVGAIMMAGSLNLTDIVHAQQGTWFGIIPRWNVLPQALGFTLFLISAIAETNRAPFDLPEAESELVAGFHVEYGGFGFAMFFLAEYISMLAVSALASVMFLGGWLGPHIPLVPDSVQGVFWFLSKMAIFIFFYFWLRATLPRFRYDHLMTLCWKVMLPLVLLNILVTGLVKALI
ncbi:MAG: NADH-quinone oxidoreductase subunit NuoH [Chloroflexota bacterium]|nr:NADH-quinone oxidoreductase subunit NuoH [Chloroflexota bacterium]